MNMVKYLALSKTCELLSQILDITKMLDIDVKQKARAQGHIIAAYQGLVQEKRRMVSEGRDDV